MEIVQYKTGIPNNNDVVRKMIISSGIQEDQDIKVTDFLKFLKNQDISLDCVKIGKTGLNWTAVFTKTEIAIRHASAIFLKLCFHLRFFFTTDKTKERKKVKTAKKDHMAFNDGLIYNVDEEVVERSNDLKQFNCSSCGLGFRTKLTSFTHIYLFICLFVSRHEVHSMNTHTLQNAGW